MKSTAIVFLIAVWLMTSGPSVPGNGTYDWVSMQKTVADEPGISASVINGIQVFGESSGIAYTSEALYRTDDNGEMWHEVLLPKGVEESISGVSFVNEKIGWAILTNWSERSLYLAKTQDGGHSWMKAHIDLPYEYLAEADLNDIDAVASYRDHRPYGSGWLRLRLASSSNFIRQSLFETSDGGHSWKIVSSSMDKKSDLEFNEKINDENIVGTYFFNNNRWFLTSNGNCEGFKAGCVQETNIYIRNKEITPPRVKELARLEKEKAKRAIGTTQMFALPPGGSTRTSLNRGFDKCTNGTVAQMQTWWNESYFFDANIYFSGRNRACSQTLSASWVDQVSTMGWGLIPTVVGYQSPCTSSATTAKLSYDPPTAEQQGRGEADIAVGDATNIGLTAGSILYYDMERYDPPSPDTLGCRTATVAFLKGWTERIRELGYKSGTYGSPKNAQEDWQFMPAASRMDAIWMARWDNVPSVWNYVTFPTFPTNVWENHQRIKQWQAPHNETWGGVTFNIDGNIADGPVAGIPVPKNKVADFDGDGKTDVSVFRPDTGQWFISGSFGPTYRVHEFGVGTDILTPGDFDGDGKTDFAVFRPSNSTWYVRAKGSYTVRQFGENGDIPAPADYNGDGRTDIAVFRPSTGVWYFILSDSFGSFVAIQFGVDGDKPAPADYDGDGKADIAVWRPSNGTWYVQGSVGTYFTRQWGVSTDLPAQADYDGDGKADFAIFRSGVWFVLQTTAGMLIREFGADGDVPSTGDFDGDGKYDIAVFRPSNGTWYMSQTQVGFSVRSFGVLNDKPISNAYLPR